MPIRRSLVKEEVRFDECSFEETSHEHIRAKARRAAARLFAPLPLPSTWATRTLHRANACRAGSSRCCRTRAPSAASPRDWRTRTANRSAALPRAETEPLVPTGRSLVACRSARCSRRSSRPPGSRCLQNFEQASQLRGVEARWHTQPPPSAELELEPSILRRRMNLDESRRHSFRARRRAARDWLLGRHLASFARPHPLLSPRLSIEHPLPVRQGACVDAELRGELGARQTAITPALDALPPLLTSHSRPWLRRLHTRKSAGAPPIPS
jgi:hypothetical protein